MPFQISNSSSMPVANNGLSVLVSAVAAQWFRVDAEFLGAIGRGQSAATVRDAQWIWLVLRHLLPCSGRGRPHRTDGGVRPEMGSHHGVRGGAPEENFGFLNAFLSKKHAPNRRTAPRSKALVETCTIPGTHKL